MFRFFVDQKLENSFILSQDVLQHIKVARIEREHFICTYEGDFYECELKGNQAHIINKMDDNHEFKGEVVLAAAIIDIKRFEWLIQKAAELGATKLIPMMTQHVAKKISGEIDKKIVRWNEIARNASEQSFRNVPMEVTTILSFKEALSLPYQHKYLAHEKKEGQVPTSLPTDSLFLIGPEGGFSGDEVKLSQQVGCEIISLGSRILRAETAGLFVLSRIND